MIRHTYVFGYHCVVNSWKETIKLEIQDYLSRFYREK